MKDRHTSKVSDTERYWDWFAGSTLLFITAGFFYTLIVDPQWWVLCVLVVYVVAGMAIGTHLNRKEADKQIKDFKH